MAFGREVGNCCRYMQECHDWKLKRVLIRRDGEKTADFGTKTEINTSTFTSTELGQANSNSPAWTAMEEIASKCGTAVIETGMLYPDADSCLDRARILSVFQKITHHNPHSAAAATAATAATGGGGGGMEGMVASDGSSAFSEQNFLFNADFKSISAHNVKPLPGALPPSAPSGSDRNNSNSNMDRGKSPISDRAMLMTPSRSNPTFRKCIIFIFS